MKPYLVLDTNIILLDANNLLTLGKDYTLVLPETVLDEIDHKKTALDPEIRFQVREFFRIMTRRQRGEMHTRDDVIVIPGVIDGNIQVETAAKREYPVFKASENDSKIIHIAKYYHEWYEGCTFMTNDTGCGERAVTYGLNVTDLKLVNTDTNEFTKEITVTSECFAHLHHQEILEVDPEYKQENFNYVFTDESTGQVKLANIRNGYVDILGKETEKELRRQDISPKNVGQLFLSRAIQNPTINIILCDAAAGTGKTLTAFSNAIQLVKRGQYKGITYIRTSVDDVEKAEESGFRSGNDEKDAPYFGPVEDTLGTIFRNRYKDNKRKGQEFENFIQEQTAEAILKYNIKLLTTLGLRGRTLDDEVVIIDEAQNYSRSSLQKVITRMGKNTLLLIVGSNNQIDHPYITRHNNGLSILLEEAKHEPLEDVKLYAVPLTKILRSPIAEFAERVFSKDSFR